MIGLQDKMKRRSTKVQHVSTPHVLSSPIPPKNATHNFAGFVIWYVYICIWYVDAKGTKHSAAFQCHAELWDLRSLEQWPRNTSLKVSCQCPRRCQLQGWPVDISLKPFQNTLLFLHFCDRTNRWQAPFVAEVKAVGVGCVVGCGLWTALWVKFGGLWKPYLHTWKRPWSGCKRWSWQRRVLSDELSLAVMGKWNTSLCKAVGKRLAQFAEPVDAILEVWFVHFDSCQLNSQLQSCSVWILIHGRANKTEQLSFAEVDRKTMAHQRRSSRCGPLERKAKLEWHHTCHHDAKLGFEIQLFVASLVYLSPST